MVAIKGLLNPDLEFISSKKFRNGHLWVVRKKRTAQACRRCGTISKRRYGKSCVLVRERSPYEVPLWLKVHKHRYYCNSCKKPFTELTPGTYLRRRSTQKFQRWIRKCCGRYKTLKEVGYAQFCSSGFVYKSHYEQLEIKTRESINKPWPKVLGIDEHFFTRRNGYPEYVTVFTDLHRHKLFEVAPTKSKRNLISYIKSIPGREEVKVVCIDLAPGYRSLVKQFFPRARIVADKFHVLKLLMTEIMKERQLVEGHHKKVLGRKKLLTCRSKLDYSTKSEIDRIAKQYPSLDELYRAKEGLRTLYRSKGLLRAYQSYRKLIKSLEKSTHPKLKVLMRTLKKWRDEILNYFEFRVTNAVTEAINGNAKALQARARGYRQFKNYRLALLNACAF